MGPIGHTLVSVGIGVGVWAASGSALAIPVGLVTGVLVDIDHGIDFFDTHEWNGAKRHMLRLLHAWEYGVLALAALVATGYHPLALAAVLAYLGHLALDQWVNRVHPLAYLIVFRASCRFQRRRLTPYLFDPAHYMVPRESMPLWGKLEPSLWRRISGPRSGRR